MKVIVTGASGQLGSDVAAEALSRGMRCLGSVRKESSGGADAIPGLRYCRLDITDRDAVEYILENEKPDALIHCAGWTDVEAAEQEANRPKARLANAEAAGFIASACAGIGCKMLYTSTDYVFDGTGNQPWPADFADPLPLTWYGKSKLEGEQAVREAAKRYFIVRTSWLFGVHGRNFVKTMLGLSRRNECVRVVDDQIGSPTYTRDLAKLLVDMIETDKYGIYHASNEGEYVSWYGFACELFRKCGIKTRVIPVSTEEYGASNALRPKNCRLDKSGLTAQGFSCLPDWKDALARFLREFPEQEAGVC